VMVNVDPDSGSREPKVLRTIAQQRETFAGVYATTVAPGVANAGDDVWLERG